MTSRDLLVYMRTQRLAVQSSVTADRKPQAAIVGFAVNEQFEIIFDTLQDTRKVRNLRRNPAIALVIGGWTPGDERTVQFEGIADEPSGEELERLKKIYYEVYPDGIARAKWPGLTYIRVKPTWLRFTDYNQNPPVIVELSGAELTGSRPASSNKSQ